MSRAVPLTQAADVLGVAYKTVWKAATAGKIKAFRAWPGGPWRVWQHDLDRLMHNEHRPALPPDKEVACPSIVKEADIGGCVSAEYDNLLKQRTSKKRRGSSAAATR